MSIMFFKVRSLSRAKGDNAVAKSAYISREKLADNRLDRSHDYRRTPGLQHREILVPEGLSAGVRAWAADRTRLWNAAEAAETRVNSRVGREYTSALPHELPADVRRELATDFARRIAERHRVAVDLAVHGPTHRGDPRNHHLHVLASTRELTEDGFGRKASIELNTDRRRELQLPHTAMEYRQLRKLWAELANERLREAGLEQRLEPRSRRDLERTAADLLQEQVSASRAVQADPPTLDDTRRRGIDRWRAYRREQQAEREGGRSPAREKARELDTGLEL